MKPAVTYPLSTPGSDLGRYRYFFNGQETDNEVFGEGVSLSAEFWQYDTRLGRRWNVDPVFKEYESPYACFAGNPVRFADPKGDTVIIPNKDDQEFIYCLLNKQDPDNYSEVFHLVYSVLEKSTHFYFFISQPYKSGRKEDGRFDHVEGSVSSNVIFTKDDNSQIYNPIIGASKYRVLFEETYHAYQFDRNGIQPESCFSEAVAWKFSALAPGTKDSFIDNNGFSRTTLMGRILNSSFVKIAFHFKFGVEKTIDHAGMNIPGLYADKPLWTDSELKFWLPQLSIFKQNKKQNKTNENN